MKDDRRQCNGKITLFVDNDLSFALVLFLISQKYIKDY